MGIGEGSQSCSDDRGRPFRQALFQDLVQRRDLAPDQPLIILGIIMWWCVWGTSLYLLMKNNVTSVGFTCNSTEI